MIHLLLDAARMENSLDFAKEINSNHKSLYKGSVGESLATFAPYLFRFSSQNKFNEWFWTNGWGKSWGLFVKSSVPDSEVYRHFRKFLLIHNEEGEQLYFRFYDPRVLRVFLPSCDEQQLHDFFGPVQYFITEDSNQEIGTYFWLMEGELKTKKLAKEEIKQNIYRDK